MTRILNLLESLDERVVAQKVALLHDEARGRYSTRTNTISDFGEFEEQIGQYYEYHFTSCVSRGGSLSRREARGRAKDILTREYRRKGGDIVTAFNDARDGTNGGLRGLFDILCEALRNQSIEMYVREQFDRHVRPSEFEEKVEIIRQFIAHCGPALSPSIRTNRPERYAQDYEELIRSYSTALQPTAARFRRL